MAKAKKEDLQNKIDDYESMLEESKRIIGLLSSKIIEFKNKALPVLQEMRSEPNRNIADIQRIPELIRYVEKLAEEDEY
jgi:hypothetical protein